MKKIFFIVFVLTNSFASIAQQPEVLKMKKDTRYGKATYYVLKSDTSVYHGRYYIDAWTGNKKLVDGNYSYGKKEGIWTEINYNKERSPRSIGEYKDDLKIGKWVYFSLDGDTSQVYNYSTSTLVFSKYCKDIELDCPAIYVGGIENLISDVQEIASDYIESLKPRPVGVVEIKTNVSITIDTTGNVKDISFTDKTGKVYEDNISKLILKKSNLWIPSKQNGQVYESKIVLPIRVRYNY